MRVSAPELRGDHLLQTPSRKHQLLRGPKGDHRRARARPRELPRAEKQDTHSPRWGFGTDENIEWLCSWGYQFVVKGYGGGRAKKLAKSVPEEDWHEGPTAGQILGYPPSEGVAPLLAPHQDGARRWKDAKGKPYSDYLIKTLTELSAPEDSQALRPKRGDGVGHKGGQKGLRHRAEEEEELFRPGGRGAPGRSWPTTSWRDSRVAYWGGRPLKSLGRRGWSGTCWRCRLRRGWEGGGALRLRLPRSPSVG